MLLMGIINVTPDSFSDGGEWADAERAIAHGRELIAQGAHILDIGGESTRPGAKPLTADQEWQRVEPVIAALADGGAALSIDTYHAVTARRAVAAGVTIINDVTGGMGDPSMFHTVAELGVDYILQHTRGTPATMNSLAHYERHVASEVREELLLRRDAAVAAGIDPARIVLDPGLGFAKVGSHDWEALGGLEAIMREGHRVLVGPSRKRFLADVVENWPDRMASRLERDVATATIAVWLGELSAAGKAGVWGARVHNVAAARVALATFTRLKQEQARYQQLVQNL